MKFRNMSRAINHGRSGGKSISVETDHDALKWLLMISNVSGELSWCHLRMYEFRFDIVQSEIIKQQATDGIKRRLTNRSDET